MKENGVLKSHSAERLYQTYCRMLRVVAIAMLVAPVSGLTEQEAETASSAVETKKSEWIQLFNGHDLSDWLVKFTNYELGVNVNDTFRIEDGILKVRYDKWKSFDGEFGHLFYKEPFAYYLLAAEYRFVGRQLPAAGPALAWARRNNGLMLHAQRPDTITKHQDFPVSIEVQLLGGLSDGSSRPTANLCTPGTHVVYQEELDMRHCIESSSKTYDGDQWVRVEVLVLGGELVRHMMDGEIVLEYSGPVIGGGVVTNADPTAKVDGAPLSRGYIGLQAETAEIDFRKVELLNLEGCIASEASRYKTLLGKSNPSMCDE